MTWKLQTVATPKKPGEFEIIRRFFTPLAAREPGAFALGDDAAVLPVPPDRRLVITADAVVCGVHFLASDPPDSVAVKLLGVNLSDLASMGAEPLAYTVTAALPEDLDEAWLAAFAGGLGEAQDRYGLTLVGGDTVGTPGPLSLSLCALGLVEPEAELRRSGAREGDRIYVSGTVGNAALGLRILKGRLDGLPDAETRWLVDRYRRPRPRVALGRRLRGLVHAAIDVSDGVVADLAHICEMSGVCARLRADRVPVSAQARRALDEGAVSVADLLVGGDDYELLFTASPDNAAVLAELSDELACPLTEIGEIVAPRTEEGDRRAVLVVDGEDRVLDVGGGGFRHF